MSNGRKNVLTLVLGLILIGLVVLLVYLFLNNYSNGTVSNQQVNNENMSQASLEVEEVGVINIGVPKNEGIVNISGGQGIEFRNSSTVKQNLTIHFQEPITEVVDPGVTYLFKYPEGYSELKFSWNGGEVLLKRR